MGETAWVVPALLTVAFLIGAGASSGLLTLGWLVLAIGMAGIAYVRFRAARSGD